MFRWTSQSVFQSYLPNWRALTLDRQFALVSTGVILIGMLAIGLWVTDRIKSSVTYRSAADATLYMENFVAPLAQELTYSDTLSLETHKKLDKLMTMLIGKRVEEIRIWRLDGTVLYSNEKEIVGKKLPLTNKFMAALSGSIGIEFGGDPHEGDESSQSYDGAILEIYAPIRNAHSGKIIAVAEFYLIEKELSKDLQRATALSWLFVGGVAFSMIAVLFGIVHSGSNMIERQKQDLAGQVGDLERLLGNNQELQQCLQCARRQTADINEKVLRRLGAELHDGPAQLVSMAILVLHSLANDEDETSQRSANFTRIESALTDSLREIRDLSAGLALPELTSANLENVVNLAVNAHKLRTKTEVICKVKTQAIQVPVFVKVCVYRFIQEALNNSFKHANGVGQSVSVKTYDEFIEINVSDLGPGFCDDGQAGKAGETVKLGLLGLQDRIETIGGNMSINSSPSGCSLTARINIHKAQQLVAEGNAINDSTTSKAQS